MNTAIIVAAGSGRRFGSDTPKQFQSILGKPIVIHTLERFENCESIDEIILVLHENAVDEISEILKQNPISKLKEIVAGGKTRSESVRNGFDSILKNAAEIVVVHDGARPLVASEEISKTIKSAEESGAACLVAEVTDTIKEVADGKIKRTVDRNSLRRALTPQCFRYEILAEAFSQEVSGETATDECYLVEKFGHEVAIVEGNARNIKITRKEDLVLVKNLLEEEMATS